LTLIPSTTAKASRHLSWKVTAVKLLRDKAVTIRKTAARTTLGHLAAEALSLICSFDFFQFFLNANSVTHEK
jgi:hypothetical protein